MDLQPPYGYGSYNKTNDLWTCPNLSDCKSGIVCVLVTVALAALAGVATYFCLVNGLSMLDTAFTTLETFGAGFLIYTGVTFSFVAVGNALYLGCKVLCKDPYQPMEYSPREAKIQVALSIFAPIAAIPGIIILSLGVVLEKKI